ncbi:MAG: response regulator transcription factor [Candidatus Moranbacteria bacterium]|nr:response regulator transcription factor [Candidatus Moranbacteria bacterium]
MRILIIEDNEDITSFLKSSLASECFAVDTASDGITGEFLALTNEYDLVILDNTLPKKNGKKVCISIREKKKNMPIIMLSVKSDIATKVELLEAGADDYLTKPFSFEELLARIHALLRRPGSVKNEKLEIKDICLDIRRHDVTKGGKSIHFTRKEFMLLELLLKHKGDVVSRGLIWEHVWDVNADPFSNTIESHIRSIRRKLNLKGKDNFIKTVSGRGYRIVEEE